MYGFKNYIEPSDLVNTLKYQVSLTVLLFIMAGPFFWSLVAFWPLRGHKHSKRRSQQSSPPSESFLSFFSTWSEIWTWKLVYTSGRWCDTSSLSFIITFSSQLLESFQDFFSKCFEVSAWKLVYTLSRLHNILSSHFTGMGSLWAASCS